EIATTQTVMTRECNIHSPKVRQACDTSDLATLTRHDPLTATGAHVSLVGHITRAELLRMLDRTELANGFANRILWVCIRRSKCLPDGGNLSDEALAPLAERLKDAIAWARYTEA